MEPETGVGDTAVNRRLDGATEGDALARGGKSIPSHEQGMPAR